jgi:hypothetical protein
VTAWPPDWQTMRVEALIGRELRLGEILVDLDELEDLLADHPSCAADLRVLAARMRTIRNDWRDQVRAWQAVDPRAGSANV